MLRDFYVQDERYVTLLLNLFDFDCSDIVNFF
jgi:hypothetical protein